MIAVGPALTNLGKNRGLAPEGIICVFYPENTSKVQPSDVSSFFWEELSLSIDQPGWFQFPNEVLEKYQTLSLPPPGIFYLRNEVFVVFGK